MPDIQKENACVKGDLLNTNKTVIIHNVYSLLLMDSRSLAFLHLNFLFSIQNGAFMFLFEPKTTHTYIYTVFTQW